MASHCGLLTSTISSGLSTDITVDLMGTNLSVQTDDFARAGTTQVVTITTTLNEYPSVTHDRLITINFSACPVSASSITFPVIAEQTYQFGDQAIDLTFQDF